ncbi:AAA family ATPase, partial [Haematobacter sp. UBA3484]|uniref:AAA family ATPase n=1 Tax=Haematobacter sp. UBA3484 TaxID=1946582 RepID=UPI0025BBEFDA
AVVPALAGVGLAAGVAPLRPHALSTGMARRVMLAAALAQEAGLIVADEPTAGLDPHHRDVILDRLRAEADRGAGVLLITHDLSAALARADSVAVLEGGALVGVEPARAFAGAGEGLSPAARRLWCALPENGFLTDA